MDPLLHLQQSIREFLAARDWQKFHDPKSLLLALVGELGELAELFQWLPASEAADLAQGNRSDPVSARNSPTSSYLLQIADSVGIDLVAVTNEKLDAARRRYPPLRSTGLHQPRPKPL